MGEGREPLVFAFPEAQLGRPIQLWLLEAALLLVGLALHPQRFLLKKECWWPGGWRLSAHPGAQASRSVLGLTYQIERSQL